MKTLGFRDQNLVMWLAGSCGFNVFFWRGFGNIWNDNDGVLMLWDASKVETKKKLDVSELASNDFTI